MSRELDPGIYQIGPCYAIFKPSAWTQPCAGDVHYHRRSDLFLCEAHQREYDADFPAPAATS